MGEYRYAIVRLPESRMIDLFTLLVQHGFSEVSFVSNLAHSTVRSDPNPAPVKEEPSVSRTHSTANTTQPIPSQPSASIPVTPVLSMRHDGYSTPPSTSSSTAPNANELLSALFERTSNEREDVSQNGVSPTKENNGWPIMPLVAQIDVQNQALNGFPPVALFGQEFPQLNNANAAANDVNGHSRKVAYTERMKGWQRKMLMEGMRNGVPTGAAFAQLCALAQVTEHQAARFFKKRKGMKLDESNYYGASPDHHEDASPEMVQIIDPKLEN